MNKIPINRRVVLLTPVFSAVAGILSAWLARHFPGLPTPTNEQLTYVEIAGFAVATTTAGQWLKGHQKYEALVLDVEKAAQAAIEAQKGAGANATQTP